LRRKFEETGFVVDELRNAGGKGEMKTCNIWKN
jgi:hypothetical protein